MTLFEIIEAYEAWQAAPIVLTPAGHAVVARRRLTHALERAESLMLNELRHDAKARSECMNIASRLYDFATAADPQLPTWSA